MVREEGQGSRWTMQQVVRRMIGNEYAYHALPRVYMVSYGCSHNTFSLADASLARRLKYSSCMYSRGKAV